MLGQKATGRNLNGRKRSLVVRRRIHVNLKVLSSSHIMTMRSCQAQPTRWLTMVFYPVDQLISRVPLQSSSRCSQNWLLLVSVLFLGSLVSRLSDLLSRLVDACPPYQDASQGLPPLIKACRDPEMGTGSSWIHALGVRLEVLVLGTNQSVGNQKPYRSKVMPVGA